MKMIDELQEVVLSMKRERPFHIDVMVILPEHLHAIWRLPTENHDYAGCWPLIKLRFIQALIKAGAAISRNAIGEYDLWQRRCWIHTIRDDTDLRQHMEYVKFNPVIEVGKWVYQWPHSTFHLAVQRRIYPRDWAGEEIEDDNQGYDG